MKDRAHRATDKGFRSDFCDMNTIEKPIYTKYVHDNGYRYEVEVAGVSFFGQKKFYPSVTEAMHACAHVAMYGLIVEYSDDIRTFSDGTAPESGLMANPTAATETTTNNGGPQKNETKKVKGRKKNQSLRAKDSANIAQTIEKSAKLAVSRLSKRTAAQRRHVENTRQLADNVIGEEALPRATKPPRSTAKAKSQGSAAGGKKKRRRGKRANANLIPMPKEHQRVEVPNLPAESPKKKPSAKEVKNKTSGCGNDRERVDSNVHPNSS